MPTPLATIATRCNELLARREDGLRHEVVFESHDKSQTTVHGVPEQVRRFEHRGAVVFRHYFQTAEQMRAALAEGSLRAGPVPYAVVAAGARDYYPDLKGVFLTRPDVVAERVGVETTGFHIDLVLPPDMPVLEIEPGRIYLIPGNGKVPDWLQKHVRTYQAGGTVPAYALTTIKKLAESGVVTPLRVAIAEPPGKPSAEAA